MISCMDVISYNIKYSAKWKIASLLHELVLGEGRRLGKAEMQHM